MNRVLWLILVGLLAWLSPVVAQETPDSVLLLQEVAEEDVILVKEKKPWPDPKKAVLWSIIPSGGQIYNRRWWKLPIVYGVYGTLTYIIIFNTEQYNRLQTAYLLELEDQDHEFTGTSIDSPNALRTLRDQYDKNRQLSYIGLFFAYVLTGVDAFVDAHLRQFDISDDLSLRARPSLQIVGGQTQVGVGLTLSF